MAKARRSPVPKTPPELRDASEMLWYEYDMMRRTAVVLMSGDHPRPQGPEGTEAATRRSIHGNVHFESFSLHVRNLMVFFGWLATDDRDDVCACDFAATWKPSMSSSDPWVEKTRRAMNKNVNHLSYGRTSQDLYDHTWNVRDITDKIASEMDQFVALAGARLLPGLDWSRPRLPSTPFAGATGMPGPMPDHALHVTRPKKS